MSDSGYDIKVENGFRYVSQGQGRPIVLLHGLFGALSNFRPLLDRYSKDREVLIPLLPLYDLSLENTSVPGLVTHLHQLLERLGKKGVTLLGNSLGGHIALLYALEHPENVNAIVLTGSSGLFESAMGDTYPKKQDYEYIKHKTEYTFFNPAMATKELVDEVFEIVNNRNKAIRILYLAKSAMRHNLRDDLDHLKCPVCLIWGEDDRITPPFVGQEFHNLLPDSELHFIPECGHAPMMEQPEKFCAILDRFLAQLNPHKV